MAFYFLTLLLYPLTPNSLFSLLHTTVCINFSTRNEKQSWGLDFSRYHIITTVLSRGESIIAFGQRDDSIPIILRWYMVTVVDAFIPCSNCQKISSKYVVLLVQRILRSRCVGPTDGGCHRSTETKMHILLTSSQYTYKIYQIYSFSMVNVTQAKISGYQIFPLFLFAFFACAPSKNIMRSIRILDTLYMHFSYFHLPLSRNFSTKYISNCCFWSCCCCRTT